MTKLKLGPIADDKPVKATVEFPAAIWRSLQAYAELHGRTTGHSIPDPAKLIVPMIKQFMMSDRVFIKIRRSTSQPGAASAERSG